MRCGRASDVRGSKTEPVPLRIRAYGLTIPRSSKRKAAAIRQRRLAIHFIVEPVLRSRIGGADQTIEPK